MTRKNAIRITESPYVSKLAKDYLLGKDIGINNPLVNNYEGIIEKAKWLHPELFEDLSAETEYKKFIEIVNQNN